MRLRVYWAMTAACGLFVLSPLRRANAQDKMNPICADTTISGVVARGERFEASLRDSLRFILDPSIGPPNPDGWTIRIVGPNEANDYLMVATPPYRFFNPRYLDTSYGRTAEEALGLTERPFNFVRTRDDFEKLSAAIGILLWQGNYAADEIQAAQVQFDSVRRSTGVFKIVEGTATPPSEDHPLGKIERVTFEVEFCLEGDGSNDEHGMMNDEMMHGCHQGPERPTAPSSSVSCSAC